ncbi:hypothetical protein Ssi03_74510 [Sphaerisporangium siamense]|uniref:Peptidase M48 domain-containing protein n=1 Tax=Sphaerisporangium siamense TaxID=795645 RepID=A0A7W7DBF9_9ACTN|nr:M48 family metalloprotease [Sphaerisporangium siamense]MBB4702303.1 hypothetical protein [Sphaerisporangium siamense]GII89461.1 hypothetical protein Ssi03_74510 [Sphaerisporangium siamense]
MCDLLNHAETLRRAAGMPHLTVTAAPHMSGAARAERSHRCSPGPTVVFGGEAVAEPPLVRLATLGHELAHHDLGHTTDPVDYWIIYLQRALGVAALIAALADAWAVLGGLATAAAMVWLATNAMYRRREVAADARALALLDRAGLPGREAMAAMHAADLVVDPWWHAAGGFVFTGHPPVYARARRLDLAR